MAWPNTREAVVRGLQQAPALDPRSNEFAHHLLGMAFSYAELRHPTLFDQLGAANRAAFAEYRQRADVQAVGIEALERKPATIAAIRATIAA